MHRLTQALLVAFCSVSIVAFGCAVGKNSSTNTQESRSEPTATRSADRSPTLLERVGHLFAPESVVKVVPAGTALAVRFLDGLSSETSAVGETVRAEIAQPVRVGDVEAIPNGSTLLGEITAARPPKIGGRAALAVSFHTLQLPSGQTADIDAGASWAGKSEKGKDAAAIAGGVIGGAILGHQVDGDQGKVLGGILGGAAGTAIAHETHGKPLIVPAGSVIKVKLSNPVRVEVVVS
jgi:hypothetical protein